MTMTDPIVPSPKQVDQWFDDAVRLNSTPKYYIARQAAQWGSDQELEACVEWFDNQSLVYHRDLEYALRTARRPNPPSLKERALDALKHAEEGWRPVPTDCDIIRRALEALDD